MHLQNGAQAYEFARYLRDRNNDLHINLCAFKHPRTRKYRPVCLVDGVRLGRKEYRQVIFTRRDRDGIVFNFNRRTGCNHSLSDVRHIVFARRNTVTELSNHRHGTTYSKQGKSGRR